MRGLRFVLILIPLFTGCSWLNELMVFNNTNEKIVVRFRCFGDTIYTGNSYTPPGAYKIAGWNKNVPVIGDTVSVYSRLEGDTLWYVELPPQTAVVIAGGSNKDFTSADQCKQFLNVVKVLRVLSPNDAVFSCSDSSCYSAITVISSARAGFVIQH